MPQEWGSSLGNGFDDYRSSESSSNRLYSVSSLPVSFNPSPGGVCGDNYIEHTVSRFDTLAGVAIKYGVEVSDVKKLNGLVSDVQMFALRTLYIPLPGRHPPSPAITDGSDDAPRDGESSNSLQCSNFIFNHPCTQKLPESQSKWGRDRKRGECPSLP